MGSEDQFRVFTADAETGIHPGDLSLLGHSTAGTFVGRQPIVDRDQHVVAYELLFRASKTAQFAEIDDVGRAAVRVIVNTFASLGMEAVLGRCHGFFNVNAEVFLSELIEALPRERVVLEILEDVEPSEEVRARCEALRAEGFTVALDDWIKDDPRESLLPFVDVVKVDLPAVPKSDLRKVVRQLREAGVMTLAEKVETQEEFALCHRLGFDRFQGYFFAKPTVIEGADLDPGKTTLLTLLQQISSEAETRDIVESCKQDPTLGLNLLRLVNSAGMTIGVRLETIEDAVRHLGLQKLGRWVAVMLYAEGPNADLRSPLLTAAAHRGRLMELVVATRGDDSAGSAQAESAFLVGMLSLADALLGRSLPALVEELSLAPEVAAALTDRAGELGQLLALAESVERGEVEDFESFLDLDLATLQQIEHDAYAWVHGLIQGVES